MVVSEDSQILELWVVAKQVVQAKMEGIVIARETLKLLEEITIKLFLIH